MFYTYSHALQKVASIWLQPIGYESVHFCTTYPEFVSLLFSH